MQKRLDQMNVRGHRAVADLDGVTGLAIVRAIVAGERDPQRLAARRDPRWRKSEAEIAEHLSGPWRADHLFSLQQALHLFDAIVERGTAYDREILRPLAAWTPDSRRGGDAPRPPTPEKATDFRKRGVDPLRHALDRVSGVDRTTIDALGPETASVVLSEYGPDLSRFATEKQFVQPVGLAPNRPMRGGQPIKRRKKPGSASARVGAALRMAATSRRQRRSALGAYSRRIAHRAGRDVAVFATAPKLAPSIYRLLRWGHPDVDVGAAAYEQRYHEARVRRLSATAQQLGYTLLAADA